MSGRPLTLEPPDARLDHLGRQARTQHEHAR